MYLTNEQKNKVNQHLKKMAWAVTYNEEDLEDTIRLGLIFGLCIVIESGTVTVSRYYHRTQGLGSYNGRISEYDGTIQCVEELMSKALTEIIEKLE